MKRYLSLTIAIVIVSGVLAVNASAQQRIRADIPFSFNVGEKTLPAGVYALQVINPTSDRKAVQIRSLDGRASAIVQTTFVPGKLADAAKLVFRRYGNQYFFAQIDMAGDATTLVAAKSRAERSTSRAIKHPADNTVVTAF